MAKRNIVWTETAAKQRREILKYWVKRNGTTTYAEKLIKITADHLKIIKENPSAFKKADFPDTRISVFGCKLPIIGLFKSRHFCLIHI
jgi:plasmid stabilization system protein ParE